MCHVGLLSLLTGLLPLGNAGNSGGSPGAWLGMCIKRGFFSQGLQEFCCLKALRSAASCVSGSRSAALLQPHVCSASLAKRNPPEGNFWSLPEIPF